MCFSDSNRGVAEKWFSIVANFDVSITRPANLARMSGLLEALVFLRF